MNAIEKIRAERIANEPKPKPEPRPSVFYAPIPKDPELHWCNAHRRRADYLQVVVFTDGEIEARRVCNPYKGKIMICCQVVNLTGLCEITETT